jgi:flagellar biosynthesis component FlhA
MAFGDAIKNYALLAIGDGLVAQIPSLIISIAAGMVVSRVASDDEQQASAAARHEEAMGLTPVLLVLGPFRTLPACVLRRPLPQLKVLSHAEVPETKTIRVASLVGGAS